MALEPVYSVAWVSPEKREHEKREEQDAVQGQQ